MNISQIRSLIQIKANQRLSQTLETTFNKIKRFHRTKSPNLSDCDCSYCALFRNKYSLTKKQIAKLRRKIKELSPWYFSASDPDIKKLYLCKRLNELEEESFKLKEKLDFLANN